MLKENLNFEGKIYLCFEIISHIYDAIKREERVFDEETFMSKLAQYYEKQDCEVEFHIVDFNLINKFQAIPKGKRYYYDKIYDIDGKYNEKSVYQELKEVFFPNEDVTVEGVQQIYYDSKIIKLIVKRNKGF